MTSRRSSRASKPCSAGDADVAVIADPWGSLVSAERLRALTAGSPGRLSNKPAPNSEWMFLDARRPPFEDLGGAKGGQLRDRPRQSR